MDIEEQRRKAEAGSRVAQTILGINYLYGYEVEIDYKEALRLLSIAGTSRALLNLGIMHAKGLGIPQNLPEAIRLFEAVGKPDDSSDAFAARIELGRIYSSGLGVPIDVTKAREWYKSAIALASDRDSSDELREAKGYIACTNKG
jgi:TPR repeat protein